MEILTHPVSISVALAVLISQVLKLFTQRLEKKVWDVKMLFTDGGMPSAHSATVIALATSVFLVEGLGTVFYLTFVFAVITLRDAFGVRWQASKHAKLINQIVAEKKLNHEHLKELVGHTPFQVYVGALLGFAIALIVFSILEYLGYTGTF